MTRFSWLRHLMPPLISLGIGAGVLTAMVLTRPEPPGRSEDERIWRVATETVQPRSIAPTLTLYGQLESPRSSTLSAGVAADVIAVPAREGQTVAQGDRLIALDRADLEATVAQRRATVAEAEARIKEARINHEADEQALARQQTLVAIAERGLARTRRLAETEMASAEQVDAAQRTLEQARITLNREQREVANFEARLARLKADKQRAEAQLVQAQRDLDRTRISAPFDGRLTSVNVAPGDRVRPGDPLVRLYDTAALEVRATIPAPRMAAVRQALASDEPVTATVTVDDLTLPARLDRLAGSRPDSAAGVAGLFQIQTEAPPALALGQFAEVAVQLPARPGLVAVPPAALYEQDRVYVVRDERLRAVTVERAGEQAVPDGPDRLLLRADALRAGDEVVTTQLPNASQGLRVRLAREGDAP
jgi:RND family efflux transporter MFP subunit